MFRITYISTLKNVFRSLLFWVSLLLVLFVIISSSAKGFTGYVVVDENNRIVGNIMDTDPEYKLEYQTYILSIFNGIKAWAMSYAIPLICMIVVMIVLNRDYSDGFFEIEKSNDINILKYYLGRLLAILTIIVLVCLTSCFGAVYYYYFSRGGLAEFSLLTFLYDSIIRILRLFLFAVIPGILVYTSLTLIVGNVFRNGLAGMMFSAGYLIFTYASNHFFRHRLPQNYFDFFVPVPDKLYLFWSFFDTEWFNEKVVHNPFNNYQMLLSTVIIVVTSIIFFVVSFLCVKRRNI